MPFLSFQNKDSDPINLYLWFRIVKMWGEDPRYLKYFSDDLIVLVLNLMLLKLLMMLTIV